MHPRSTNISTQTRDVHRFGFESTGALDDPEVAPPSAHYGVEGRISWLVIDDNLPQICTDENEYQKE
jgi:hypothetical protein